MRILILSGIKVWLRGGWLMLEQDPDIDDDDTDSALGGSVNDKCVTT